MIAAPPIAEAIIRRLGSTVVLQPDPRSHPHLLGQEGSACHGLLSYLKDEIEQPYKMLYDLTAIDERMRTHRDGQPASDFTVVYHLLSFDRNEYVRIKVALAEDSTVAAEHHGYLARGQLVRARSVGHVRNRL